jgi:hypothetical protein
VFAAFTILGLFSSLVPVFLYGILGVRNLALIGATSFLIFIIAANSQAVSAPMPARRSVTAGLPLLLVCLAVLESALFAKVLWPVGRSPDGDERDLLPGPDGVPVAGSGGRVRQLEDRL